MTRWTVVLSVLAAGAGGCGPKPEEVCAHLSEVAKKENAKEIANCTFKMTEKYDTKREEYDKLAPCLMAAQDMAAVNECLEAHQK
jgi:hypothetical protein